MGLERSRAWGPWPLSMVTGADTTQNGPHLSPNIVSLLPHPPHLPCSTHLNGLGGLLNRVLHQWFLRLRARRVSQRGEFAFQTH